MRFRTGSAYCPPQAALVTAAADTHAAREAEVTHRARKPGDRSRPCGVRPAMAGLTPHGERPRAVLCGWGRPHASSVEIGVGAGACLTVEVSVIAVPGRLR
jgi:hypothetical protein